MMKKIEYLDMDGTIADLYNNTNWLARLRNEDKTIFLECKPIITEETLFNIFPKDIYEIVILTMTPMNCSQEYHNQVIEQKKQWLAIYFPNIKRKIFKKYGHNKNLKNCVNTILVDDNETIRNCFKGLALNPANLW